MGAPAGGRRLGSCSRPPIRDSRLPGLAWVALVPLILASRGLRVRAGFGLGWIAGTLFFLASMYWLWRVTLPGLVFLAVYCGLYTGLFAAFLSAWTGGSPSTTGRGNVYLVLAGSTLWAGLELLRSTLFTGFTWNTLGRLAVRQPVAHPDRRVHRRVRRLLRPRGGEPGPRRRAGALPWMDPARPAGRVPPGGPRRHRAGGRVAWRSASPDCARSPPPGGLVVGCVQPDISQYAKWDDAFEAHIRTRLQELSSLTLIAGRDLTCSCGRKRPAG
ncbi:MAG: hypothetical protein U1F77_11745 [Kiritimatiellia bacterium]